ncbi:hypothetical protein Syun_017694 [Stephania yunnanensis]|uniref:Uncharacterized protein n=1 Tax=Stephania yunnanensis TaxID=152371 RepID=A0AAP0J9R9_9MAGN
MSSLSGLGLGLSVVLCILLLALISEIYYMFLWRKKSIDDIEAQVGYSTPPRHLFNFICRNKSFFNPTSVLSVSQGHELQGQELELDSNSSSKQFFVSPCFGNGIESELMVEHNIAGPPRLLFTITEETKEDLESDDGRLTSDRSLGGSRMSLRDFLSVETPFMTPLSSPPFLDPPISPRVESYCHNGFNPLFESSATVNSGKFSPPSKFKFLRDAEEKLYIRNLMEEAQLKLRAQASSSVHSDDVGKAIHDSSISCAVSG